MNKNKPELLKLEVGKYYKTYGGWKALVIWKVNKWLNINHYVLVIHKPETADESNVVSHDSNGRATSILSINAPPQYTEHHPADLKEERKTQCIRRKSK